MNKEKKLGQEPAYPNKRYDINGAMDRQYKGMSKRFYAACAAMQGILSNPAFSNMKSKPSDISKMSLGMADELLRQENE